MQVKPRAFAYAKYHAIDDFLRLGWLPPPAPLEWCIHDIYAVMLFWICDCEPVMVR